MATAMQSAVRLPSPDAADAQSHTSGRKRSPESRSPSPERRPPTLRTRSIDPDMNRDPTPPRDRSRSPLPHRNGPLPRDVDRQRALERQRQAETRRREEVKEDKPLSAAEKQAAAKAEYERLLTMRSGGTYVPPARLRALQAEIGNDPSSKEFQRMAWEALKKSINGLINKVNVSNIKYIVPELFSENLIRGRGLFCRSIMKAQAASLPFTPIYAAMVSIVNTKLPQVGELLVNRLVVQFRKAFKRNDKAVCLSSTTFLAHLINQQVAHEMLAAQILLLLLNKPTDDSVEIAVGLMREVGQHVEEFNSQIAMAVYDQFRSILHEADIDKRTQYMVEVLFQVRKDRYKDNPSVKEELDLVEEEDQITHNTGLDDQVEVQDGLNVFKFDADWEANEEAYKKLRAEILGEADGSDEDDDDDSDVSSSEDEDEEADKQVEIKDQSNTDLVNLRRTIYLTIMSSGGFEECTHKLLRINLPPGLEHELPSMIVECCSQERTYNKFFGLIGERLCKINRMWNELFEASFVKYYDTIHRLETNRLRIVAQFFGHLLSTDAIGWHVISAIHLNEDETTSSSRIFIKILIEELAQNIGMKKLSERMKDDALLPALAGIFPVDNPRNTRFSINFFTAIGMGVLTEGMREYLKNMPKPTLPALPVRAASPSETTRATPVVLAPHLVQVAEHAVIPVRQHRRVVQSETDLSRTRDHRPDRGLLDQDAALLPPLFHVREHQSAGGDTHHPSHVLARHHQSVATPAETLDRHHIPAPARLLPVEPQELEAIHARVHLPSVTLLHETEAIPVRPHHLADVEEARRDQQLAPYPIHAHRHQEGRGQDADAPHPDQFHDRRRRDEQDLPSGTSVARVATHHLQKYQGLDRLLVVHERRATLLPVTLGLLLRAATWILAIFIPVVGVY
ncbi:MIF4G-domain-containing protein [Aureobasidium subglaciale]|nr:MIF4G-domain-containing protein [Aureobasidium subglaciale]